MIDPISILVDLAICVPTCATICYLLDKWRHKREQKKQDEIRNRS